MIDPKTKAFYDHYEPSVEDLLEIQAFFDECTALRDRSAFHRLMTDEDTLRCRPAESIESAILNYIRGTS